MDLKRRVRDRISFVLLIIGNIATTLSGKHLVCTNDYIETFICHFEAQNCSEYSMTLRNEDEDFKGTFTQCDVGQCCCSIEKMALILMENYTVTVWKDAKIMESKVISVKDSIKPKTPTIDSVEETNGNFQVKWISNMESVIATTLTANVTYHKKGDTENQISVHVKPLTIGGLNSYEILGENLEPSTIYAVSVKSYTDLSQKYSDSSKEWEFTTRKHLVCTNDYNTTFICHFEAQNCSEYSMTLRNEDDDYKGTFTQCDVGQCCCSIEKMLLILMENYTVTVWKDAKIMESKVIRVKDTIKPKTPTIDSVEETNGNFQVKWISNMKSIFTDTLTANVTYHKKGDTENQISVHVKPSTIGGLNSYEILGKNLEPSTTYIVSVKSYTDFSQKYSDSSNEWEFTTPVYPYALPLAIIISLSFSAVIITGVLYICFVKLQTKWWDTVAKCPIPKLCVIHPSEQKVLKPGTNDFSIAYVEPRVPDDSKPWSRGSLRDTSSGISIGSSCLSYANTEPADIKACVEDALHKVFPNISLLSHLTTKELNKDSGLLSSPTNPCDGRADDTSCWSSDLDNKTYSILIPSCTHQIVTNSSEVQTQAEMLCDSAYHPIAGAIVTSVDPQTPACPPVNSPPGGLSLMPTDMSYQQCNADSVGFSSAEDSSLSSVSRSTNTIASCDPVSRVEARCESSQEAVCATKEHGETEGSTIIDEKPCHGCVPAGSYSFTPMDDDYQPFNNLVEQADILFS